MQPGQQNLNLNQTTEIKCQSCGNNSFTQSVMLRRVPKLLVGALQDQIIPIQIFNCIKCNEIVEELLPEELRTAKFEEIEPVEEKPKSKLILG